MIESDADRALFFDTEDFGEEVVITLAGGDGPLDPIPVIWDAPPVSTRSEENRFPYSEGAKPSGSSPRFRCQAADLPKSYAGRGTFERHGKIYVLFKIEHDGTGQAFAEAKLA